MGGQKLAGDFSGDGASGPGGGLAVSSPVEHCLRSIWSSNRRRGYGAPSEIPNPVVEIVEEAKERFRFVRQVSRRLQALFPEAEELQKAASIFHVAYCRWGTATVPAGPGRAADEPHPVRTHFEGPEEQRFGDPSRAGNANHRDFRRDPGAIVLEGLKRRMRSPIAHE